MCESQEIRYVHFMEHPDYPDTLQVGCVCAEHMSGDYIGPKRREKALQSAARRRATWLTRNWRVSAKGNDWLRTDGFHITVFRKDGAWGGSIRDEKYERPVRFLRRRYPTSERAKLAAFDAMIFFKGQREP
jgi:hypothetical protein